MSVDYISRIVLNLPVEFITEVIEEKLTKYDENTGQPYLKTNRKSVTSYLIGEHSFSERELLNFCEENDITYDDNTEQVYKTIYSLDERGWESVDFCISDLEEAKEDLIELLEKKGIKVDEDEIGFELVHFLC